MQHSLWSLRNGILRGGRFAGAMRSGCFQRLAGRKQRHPQQDDILEHELPRHG